MEGFGNNNEVKSGKLWRILIIAGTAIVMLVVVLVAMIVGDDAQKRANDGSRGISVPEDEFIYNPDEEYGTELKLSSELQSLLFGESSDRYHDAIMRRISAWFAIEYPKYESFGLVKDSYKKKETEKRVKIEAKMVSNFGTIVGLEIIDELDDLFTTKTTIRLLTTDGEEAYKTDIIWEDLDV